MRDDGITQMELARRTKQDKTISAACWTLTTSHIGLVEDALERLGRWLVVSVEDAA